MSVGAIVWAALSSKPQRTGDSMTLLTASVLVRS